ncbi:GtrA family protein [Saccharopolyspora hirsuta]|uniref:GtrA family protein n=1 Tax=Saccharopolyspora hirsuta TaxID=1837 RepID=A0A5M7BFC2_SACHI|nr:GtrA family protein [Saccharopolyspora hirsuta]KAA5827197.1 GtrA family protein [Saccharopolyspora hirsuta]
MRRGAQLGRFALVGGANTTVHCAVYFGLFALLPYLLAHVVATAVATLCSYLLNCRFTFGVPVKARTLLLFPLANLALIGLSTAAVAGAVAVGVDPVLAPFVGGAAVLPATFVASRAVLTSQRGAPRGDWPVAAGVAAVVAVLGQIPLLVNPSFYFWDDSAAQFLPMWHRLGERLLAGDWPLALDLDSWMGGNLAAEALFGIWNPVHLLDFLLVVWIGDLAIAAAVVKTQFLVILGVGTFLLCRSYGATRGIASALGAALPVSGFVLYFQAGSWAGGLMGLAWVPWAWWALRGTDRVPAFVAWLLCFLCVSAGDPYSVLALCLVFVGLLVEGGRSRVRLVLLGVAVAAVLPLVYGPVLSASEVGWRSGYAFFNIGQLVPGIGDLLNASLPSFLPQIPTFGTFRMSVPGTYFAWFAVPLLAWLDWRAVRWRSCAVVLAGCYFLLCLGPSNLWLFRWPLRNVVVLHLAVAVLLAVALSGGLRTDRFKVRLACSAGSMLVAGYLAVAAWPAQAPKHLVSLLVVGVLVLLVLRTRMLAAVLHLGTACVLALQVLWFPVNRDIAAYNFPTDVGELRARFAPLNTGTVVQIADRGLIPPEQIASRQAWSRLLFGNMPAAAGMANLVSYTGIGYDALHTELCLNYFGATCPHAYDRLWKPDGLADQLRAEHVVVQRRLREVSAAPEGWRIARRDPEVVVLSREAPIAWPEGRLGAARGVRVLDDVQHGQVQETVRFADAGERSELVFARLAWPGYRAEVDGRPVPVGATEAGLLRVSLPSSSNGVLALSWSPPGFAWHIALLCVGAALAAVLSAVPLRGSR